MHCTEKPALLPGVTAGSAVATLAMALAASLLGNLPAQEEATEIPDLSSAWQRIRIARPDELAPDARGFGSPREFPLNARGIGMREAFDESLHPMYDCVPVTIPQILGDPYNFSIEQQADRVFIRFEKDDVRRTVWLEGHGHREPTANDYSIQGYSTGRYENGELLVETTRYAFNPAGINDRSPMAPSSTSKRTVERYSRDGEVLTVDVVLEDPLMLSEPIRFSYQFEPTDTPLVDWLPCDPAQARAPLRYIPEEDLKYGIR